MDKKIKPKRGDAFDIPEFSAVARAVQPRQAAYRAGPGIVITGAAAGSADAHRSKSMRLTRI